MKKLAIAACWIAFLSPFPAYATDFDYPALGVKLTGLPNSAKSLGVTEVLEGYQVEILFGVSRTSVRILRLDQPVPQGNIADQAYRDALLKQLGIHPVGRALPLLSIAGQPVWGMAYAQGLGPMVAYQCTFYLAVGGHLYEISVSAVGEPRATKASFNTAAEEVASGLVFEPVQPPPEKTLASGEMPKFLMGSSTMGHYPDLERRNREQGVVDVEFSIDGRGTARDVKVTNHAKADFSKEAELMLKTGGFKIPQDWEQSGASKQSFTMEFRFGLNCPATFPPSKVPEPQVVTICGSSIPAP